MALTAPPTAPSTSDPSTFASRADALVAWMATNVSEMNAFQAALTAIAAGAAQSMPYTVSSTTTDSDPGAGFIRFSNFADQTAATTLRLDLVDAAGSTQTDVIATFDDSTSTVKGYIRLVKLADATKWLLFSVSALASPSGYRNVTVAHVAGSGTAPFANSDSVILEFSRTGDKGDAGTLALPRITRTSNTILGAADDGSYVEVTSGTFTQTIDTAANVGSDWFVVYANNGTGTVTFSDTISGVANRVLFSGESMTIQSDGSTLSCALQPTGPRVARTQTASASAQLDFTLPAGFRFHRFDFANLIPATDNTQLRMLTSTDGGSSFSTGASDYYTTTTYDTGTTTGAAAITITTNVGNAANEVGVTGYAMLANPSTAQYCLISGDIVKFDQNGALRFNTFSGVRVSAGDVDAIRVLFSSGNITSGTITHTVIE